jgi:hypothetical protein
MTAIVVTVTHQSEDLFFEFNPDFVTSQFLSTRNAKTNSIFSDWLWGGMQWQLGKRRTDIFYQIVFLFVPSKRYDIPMHIFHNMCHIEHHLFPSIPRSKYPALSKVIQKFAVDNNLEYR